MVTDNINVFIVYFSPAGTTRHVAEVIKAQFKALGTKIAKFNLSEQKDLSDLISKKIQQSKGRTCLFVGSPVYASHAVPQVMDFIFELKLSTNSFAVPFVTWGGASSGLSLFEMGEGLFQKGFTILGAVKVLAVHSLMWQLDNPLGKGRPDPKDEGMFRELVNDIHKKLYQDNPKGIELSRLAYQSKAHRAEMEQTSLKAAKAHMPIREVDQDLCAQCQTCAQVCPADAVTYSPYPDFETNCIFCFNCMRHCPEQAIKADLSGIWQRIKDRADHYAEFPYTQIFY